MQTVYTFERDRRANRRINPSELDWARRTFPRVVEKEGREAAVDLIFLRRDLQRELGLGTDDKAPMLCQVLAAASKPLTKAEVLGQVRKLPDGMALDAPFAIRGYFARAAKDGRSTRSLLARGLARVAGYGRDHEPLYEVTDLGRTLAESESST